MLAAKCDVRIASNAASFTTVFLSAAYRRARHDLDPSSTGRTQPRHGPAHDEQANRRDRAHRIGLVDYLCEPDDLVARAKGYVREIAENMAPVAFAETKSLMYCKGCRLRTCLPRDDAVQWKAVARPDATEGARALMEKSPAKFERLG